MCGLLYSCMRSFGVSSKSPMMRVGVVDCRIASKEILIVASVWEVGVALIQV